MPTQADEDGRLVIQHTPYGGYVVTEFMGARMLFSSGELDDALGFIKDVMTGAVTVEGLTLPKPPA